MATNYIAPTWRMPENTNKDKLSNYSLDLDGAATTNINVGNMTAIQGASTFSIAAWINVDFTGQERIFGSWEATATKRIAGFGIHTNNKLLLQISRTGSSFDQLFSTSTIASANTWYHVAVTFSSGTAEFYIDGASAGTDTSSTTSVYNISNDYFIGAFLSSSSIPFDGKMDQVCVFDYALSTDQVTYLYNLNNPMAITGKKPTAYYAIGDNSNPSALIGYPNLSIGGRVFNFDGINDYLDFNNASANLMANKNAISVSGWFKLNSNTNSTLAGNWYGGTTIQYLIRYNSGAGFGIQFYLYANSAAYRIDTNYFPRVGDWVHVVGVKDPVTNGGQMRVYIDTTEYTLDNTDLSVAISNNSRSDQIGVFNNTSDEMNGAISNVAYWTNTALTQAQVQTIYNNGVPGDISSLSPVAWYKLNGIEDTFNGSNWTIKDYGSGSNNITSSGMNSSNLVQSTLSAVTPYSNYSVKFGSTDYFEVDSTPLFNGATSLSISAWCKIDSNVEEPICSIWDRDWET